MSTEVERSFLKIFNDIISLQVKSLAFISSASDEGVTEIAVKTAVKAAQFGKKCLLVDGVGGENSFTFKNELQLKEASLLEEVTSCVDYVSIDGQSIAVLPIVTVYNLNVNSRERFEQLNQFLLSQFDLVIYDCESLDNRGVEYMSPLLITETVQATLLVALSGKLTMERLTESVKTLVRSGSNLIGMILNDRDYPGLADELCRETHRFDKIFPKLMQKLRDRITKSNFLNLDV